MFQSKKQADVPDKKKVKVNNRRKPEKKYAFIQVGIIHSGHRPFKYSEVPTDNLGWVTDMRYRPYNFDMVLLRVLGKDRLLPGWWDGIEWRGRKVRRVDQVTAWKRTEEYA